MKRIKHGVGVVSVTDTTAREDAVYAEGHIVRPEHEDVIAPENLEDVDGEEA